MGDLALIILAVGVVFWLNSGTSIDKDKFIKAVKKADVKLQEEFNKRDREINKLKEKIKALEKSTQGGIPNEN